MDRGNKKSPVNMKLIRGFPVSPRTLGNHPVTAGVATQISSDRSSDFRFVLLIAPSRRVVSVACVRCSSPVTAAGPSRIFTGFPFDRICSGLLHRSSLTASENVLRNLTCCFRTKSRITCPEPPTLTWLPPGDDNCLPDRQKTRIILVKR